MTITIFKLTLIILLIAATTGCSAKPTESPILADSAFSAQALLDANGNGQIDSEDTPVPNAAFYVEVNGIKAFGDSTDETGNAFIIIPGGVKYPVDVSMEAPQDSTLKLITPSTVSVSASTGTVQFLFSSK
ncbi:MAG: hypothetical protein ABI904_20300 [Chloroflexota bacterium]